MILAIRRVLRSPGFTLAVVLTIGLGVGVNAAVFSFVNGLILQPLPYEQPDRLVSLQVTDAPVPIRVTPADYADWKERARVFDSLSAYTFRVHGITSVDGSGEDELVFGVGVSAGFFDTLRAPPLLGRTLRAGEDEEGQDHVAVLSHGRWQRSFGGDPDVAGREIVLDGRAYTIVGVMPEDFDFPVEGTELWTPMVLTPALRDDRRNYTVMVVARLHDGVTLQQAQAHMEVVARQVADVQRRSASC